MSLSRILRLAPRCQFGKTFNNGQLGMLQAIRPVTLRVEQAKPIPIRDHDEKNMNLKRPMTPFMIIAPQVQWLLSFTHRISGVAMAAYLVSFGIGTLVLPQDISTYIAAVDAMNIPSPILYAARVLMVWPFTYHGVNGIRHLIWDMGKLLNIKQVVFSGYLILGLSIVLALGLAS
ncbi:hypothetical protein HHI36_017817 [Cryptolaemus montrouzieri]|uniref:Succinate dehydrogenase cytochrome b560 subunit, mitochondrial n=1 Tax=Cryptolaemus montrouzieri TaxID=559131 RepID=A0ABD2NP31_9CUCU